MQVAVWLPVPSGLLHVPGDVIATSQVLLRNVDFTCEMLVLRGLEVTRTFLWYLCEPSSEETQVKQCLECYSRATL